MSKRIRPWDVHGRFRSSRAKGGHARGSVVEEQASEDEVVPFVTVPVGKEGEAIKYYADRFYLNETVFDENYGSPDASPRESEINKAPPKQQQQQQQQCHCGSRQPPPLFSRSRLVASLKLKAVVLGTYNVQPACLPEEFPTLFGPDATVPVHVLHGQKGWSPENEKEEENGNRKKEEEEDDDESHHAESEPLFESPPDDNCTVGTQEEGTVEFSKRFHSPLTPPSAARPVGEEETTGHNENRRHRKTPDFPPTVHFTEILPAWIPPQELASLSPTASSVVSAEGTLTAAVVEKRKAKRGVHHPKFMILLEESGSVVIVVSTANLTCPMSTDASWVQRFPAASVEQPTANDKTDGSDFGAVLANFLQFEMLASREGQLTVQAFVQRYLGWKSLKELERRFDYSSAQVHLIPHVPGDHEGRERTGDPPPFLYGRQRVAHLTESLSLGPQPWFPPAVRTDQDRLIVQPTSLGGDWNRRNMAAVVQSYLGNDSRATDHSLLERMDIVWPTAHFVHGARRHGRKSPNSEEEYDVSGFATTAENEKDREDMESENGNGGFLFLSSETFNKIELSCLSQMVMFEPSVPAQRPHTLTPHFKSVARLFEGNDYRLRRDYGFPKSDEYFLWFMLTSACLSRGAQGEETADRPPGSDAVSYSNFELGVLFCSRLQGIRGKSRQDRLYCWKPSQCSCTRRSGPRLIHLPSPYCFRPARYQEDVEETEFCETPYFHEILPGTECVGNMRLTPYGEALAASIDGSDGI
jgi:hypothetical protein